MNLGAVIIGSAMIASGVVLLLIKGWKWYHGRFFIYPGWLGFLLILFGFLILFLGGGYEGYSPTAKVSDSLFRTMKSEAVDLGEWYPTTLEMALPVSIPEIRASKLSGSEKLRYFTHQSNQIHPVALFTVREVDLARHRPFTGDVIVEIATGQPTRLFAGFDYLGKFDGKISLLFPIYLAPYTPIRLLDEKNQPLLATIKTLVLADRETTRLNQLYDTTILERQVRFGGGAVGYSSL